MKRGTRVARPTQNSRNVLQDCIGHYLDSLPASYGAEQDQMEGNDEEEDTSPLEMTFRATRLALD